jgi:Fe-S-cluster containining protein
MSATRRFACTQCGKCCNRSPEVELSEAAALADVFVFRLMFRLYRLPRALADFSNRTTATESAELFYQRKRLLSAFAAHKCEKRMRREGKLREFTQYLTISALALDTRPGACSALTEGRCGIYERRPLACRTVPFHYSHAEASFERDFDSFRRHNRSRLRRGRGRARSAGGGSTRE